MVLFRFKGIEDNLTKVHFSSKKLLETGFEFKYSLEDMFVGAVDACKAKGLLPPPTERVEKQEAGDSSVVHVEVTG